MNWPEALTSSYGTFEVFAHAFDDKSDLDSFAQQFLANHKVLEKPEDPSFKGGLGQRTSSNCSC